MAAERGALSMTRTIIRRWVGVCLLVTGYAANAAAATITIGPGASVHGFDVGASNSFLIGQGQTFVVPTGFPILESFSMAYTVMDVIRPANRS
jgi:hypothetical protein